MINKIYCSRTVNLMKIKNDQRSKQDLFDKCLIFEDNLVVSAYIRLGWPNYLKTSLKRLNNFTPHCLFIPSYLKYVYIEIKSDQNKKMSDKIHLFCILQHTLSRKVNYVRIFKIYTQDTIINSKTRPFSDCVSFHSNIIYTYLMLCIYEPLIY